MAKGRTFRRSQCCRLRGWGVEAIPRGRRAVVVSERDRDRADGDDQFLRTDGDSITMPLLLGRACWSGRTGAALVYSRCGVDRRHGVGADGMVAGAFLYTSHFAKSVSGFAGGNSWSLPVLIVLLLLYACGQPGGSAARADFPRIRFFIWSALWWLAVYILGFRWFGFQVAGNPIRLIPEMDLFAILCFVQLAGIIWRSTPETVELVPRIALLVLLFFAYRPSWRYLKHAYHEFPKASNWQEHVEYKTETWLYEHFPDERAFVTGTIRFWYDTWHRGRRRTAPRSKEFSILCCRGCNGWSCTGTIRR